MTSSMPSSSSNEPPLITETLEETDPVTGAPIKIVRIHRGMLVSETRWYAQIHPGVYSTRPTRECLEEHCAYLRDMLEQRGLPSDRTPDWIKIGDGEWTPLTDANKPPDSVRSHYSLWIKRVKMLTEPITVERAAAELLFSITELLKRDGIDDHLWHIAQFAYDYSDYRVLNRYNALAHQGLRARNGRQQGPRERKRRTAETRKIVWSCAQRFWDCHPAYRGQASNTAAQIAAEVNDQLRAQRLLPDGKLGLST